MISIDGTKGITLMSTIGSWAGFSFQKHSKYGYRIVLGFISFELYKIDIVALLNVLLDKQSKET